MTCECCGGKSVMVRAEEVFVCQCTDELFCRACNKCEKHCKCDVMTKILDVPLTEQLLVAKFELRRLGVAI